MACASVFDVSGATSPSCKVTQAIRNVHDQLESLWRRHAIINLMRPIEFKIIPQPRSFDARHQWRNTGRVFVAQDFFRRSVWPCSCSGVDLGLSPFNSTKKPSRSEIKGLSPITGILFQTNDVRLRGGRVKACSFGRKIGIFGLLRVVLHGSLVVLVTKKSTILQTSLTWRPSSCSWPSPSLPPSSAELTRYLHDLAPSLALSVIRRTNGGRYAPTPLKKKHEKSPSVEPGISQAFPKILLRARHHHVYRIM